MHEQFPKASDADITFILEGTYPFVRGGVSSWVYQLMQNLPQYRFAIIFLGGQQKEYTEVKYPFPENLVHLQTHFLFDEKAVPKPKHIVTDLTDFKELCDMHADFKAYEQANYHELCQNIRTALIDKQSVTVDDFLYSRASWNYLVRNYYENCPEISFLDYFWSMRNMHAPLWEVIKIVEQVPQTNLFHSISTGYAGFLGALLQSKYKKPFIISEHGIYVKERKIDLLKHQWVAVGHDAEQRLAETHQYLTQSWIKFFNVLARFTYTSANYVVSLFSNYQKQQIADGAPIEKTQIIPNGVTYPKAAVKAAPNHPPIVALIGRVVAIKDIKTFIRAMLSVSKTIPGAVAWVVGPEDEDPIYAAECKELVNVLHLKEVVLFKGMQNTQEILPQIDLIVLSSISEGLSLVLLEGFAAGIPAVATNVGAGKELIEGKNPEDKQLGKSGILVEIANANALAEGICHLLGDTLAWQDAQRAARERVKKYYNQDNLLTQYTELYEKAF